VQSAGHAYRLVAQRLKEEFHRNGAMQLLLLRYTQTLLAQMAQTAVCNRHHSDAVWGCVRRRARSSGGRKPRLQPASSQRPTLISGIPWLQFRAMNIIYESILERSTEILLPSSMVDSLNPSGRIPGLALAGNEALKPNGGLSTEPFGPASRAHPRMIACGIRARARGAGWRHRATGCAGDPRSVRCSTQGGVALV
jgi:hypothetical protein